MSKTCLVIGDLMLDKYLYGSVSRISPEAPIPIVHITKETEMLGGAANVASNLRGLGLHVIMSGCVGQDYEGDLVCSLLQERGIEFRGIRASRPTTVKTRIIGQSQQIVRIDKEKAVELSDREEQALLEGLEGAIAEADCVVISDYKKGVCTEKVCQYAIQTAHKLGKQVLVDPKQASWVRYRGADLIKPNFGEFCTTIAKRIENEEGAIADSAKEVLQDYALKSVLVTRSQYGMTLVEEGGHTYSYSAMQKEVYDVSGAGDTVLAALAAGICWGYSLDSAVELANVAAGIAVSKSGTYTVKLNELMAVYQRSVKCEKDGVVTDLPMLLDKVQMWKKLQKKIVFTNGCFDILHRGHVTYLKKAKELGDILIVGVNSDASVKRLKGEIRPVNKVEDRVLLLEALSFVDETVVFEEDTPFELIKAIRPDILVKGGDYKAEEVVGREFAGEVQIISFVEGYSTTGILERK